MTAPPVAEATHTEGSSSTTTDALRSRTWIIRQVDRFIAGSPRYFSPMQRRAFLRRVSGMWRAELDRLDDPRSPHDKSWREDPTGETAIRNVIRAVARGR